MAEPNVSKVESGPRHATYHVTAYGRLVGVIYETSYSGRTMYGAFLKTETGLFPLESSAGSMDDALEELRRAVRRRNRRKRQAKSRRTKDT